jgi:glycosyltransferase involved in cell wall biosynthesis
MLTQTKSINILFIESGTSGGGSFQSLYEHLRVINRQLFHPVVVYLNDNRYIEPVKALGIPVYLLSDWLYSNQNLSCIHRMLHKMMALIEKYIPMFYITFLQLTHKPLLASLCRIICKEKIDIMHLNVQINRDFFGLFVSVKTKLPCISHLRSMRSGGFDRYRAAYANRAVSMFIANSKSTKQHWRELGIDVDKTRVVYNAINKEQIKPINIRRTWKIKKSVRFIIGCVGIFADGKGHGFLLQTFAKFVKVRSDIILLLIGDGPEREKLVQQSIKLGIHDLVVFTGYSEHALNIIADLDLLVLPSQTEAFGRVLLEAMQAKTAIVATDTGGIPEIVEHDYNGLLVSYGDEEGLQKAMDRILTDKELCNRLIENARQTVNRFSMVNYAADLECIYRDVMRQKN